MKKVYIRPVVEISEIVLESFITASGVSGGSKDIPYGGVDTEGTKDPSSRSFDTWDDEEDETDEW